jgi:predicted transcriptional regulator
MATKRKEEKMIRTSITLPEELFKNLQHLAVDESKTLKELMSEAIAEYVRRKRKEVRK